MLCCSSLPYNESCILDGEYSERWSISYCLHYETRTICRALDWTGQCTRSRRHRLPWCHPDSVWSPCSAASLADLQSAQVKHIICNYLSLNSVLIRILFTQYTLFLSLYFPSLSHSAPSLFRSTYSAQPVAICPRWSCLRWIDFPPDMLNICHRPRGWAWTSVCSGIDCPAH